MKFKQISILIFVLAIFFTQSASAKLFEHNEGAKIYIGEVAGYGEHELQPQFLDMFKEQLGQMLRENGKGKIQIVEDNSLQGENNFNSIIKVDNVWQNIHMDAICHGPQFNIADANAKMIFFAEKAMGEDYFWDDDKLAARKKMIGKPYRISEKMTTAAKTIGEAYQADYLLFCNLVDADIVFKNSIFKMNAPLTEKPKQIKVVSFFYLIDTKTGLVYEGYNMSDKTSQILNILEQKGIDIEAKKLLDTMFMVHSKRIAEDVANEGTKILSKGI